MRTPAALLLATTVTIAVPAAAPAAPPVTVPALHEWRADPGTFALRPDARIVVRHRERKGPARREARVLAEDLGRLVGRRVTTTARRGASARPGDVVLSVGSREERLGREGYRLRVGRALTIVAREPAGAFYGGRTLLQLVRGGEPIPRGRALDVPDRPERGLMIDVGRRFYPRAWLEARIRELASLKLNLLHLHLSDNQGFRVESRTHPEAVTAPFLTHADLRRLQDVAARHHVTIVPEIDMPGHLEAALRAHPELQLTSIDGRRQPDKLDITNPAARTFARDIVGELLGVFDGPYWHMGADEYLGIVSTGADYALYPQLEAYADARHGAGANGKDAVLDFVAEIGAQVRAAGRELRVWSDGVGGGARLSTDPRTVVEWWEERHSPTPEALVAAGHRVVNSGWWPTYYVTGGPAQGLRTPVEQMFERWRPTEFTGPYTARWGVPGAAPAARLRDGEPKLLGAKLQVWNDDPAAPGGAPDAVAAGIRPRLRVLAQHTWGSRPASGDYATWSRRTEKAAGPGE